MSTKRRESSKDQGKGPNGRNLCRCGCGVEVEGRRLNWATNKCVEQWKERNDPQTIRRAVFKRDRGICAACGIDTEQVRIKSLPSDRRWALVQWMRRRLVGRGVKGYEADSKAILIVDRLKGSGIWDKAQRYRAIKSKQGWTPNRRTFWDADHIVPVVEGGGQCGLDNYRTLCVPCHKRVTRELAARRAAARRQQPVFTFAK